MTRVGSVRPLGKVRRQCLVAADRLGLHPELLGLRQADRCAQQSGAQQRQSGDRHHRDTARPPCHRLGDAVPDSAVGKGFRSDLRDERPEQPLTEQGQQWAAAPAGRTPRRPPDPTRPARRDCGCSATTRTAASAAPAPRWRCSRGSRVLPGAPRCRARRGDSRCGPTPLGNARSAAARSWCPPRTPARW